MDTSPMAFSKQTADVVAKSEEPNVATSSFQSSVAFSRLVPSQQIGETSKGGDKSITADVFQSPLMITSLERKISEIQPAITSSKFEALEGKSTTSSLGAPGKSGSAYVGNAGSRNEGWYNAIEGKDCKKLLEILRSTENEDERVKLLAETGEKNRIALHVACMQGCFSLVKEIIPDPKEYIDAYYCIDGRSGVRPKEMADHIGNQSIKHYLQMGVGSWKKGMYAAYPESEWNLALVEENCIVLQKLVQFNSRHLLEYSESGAIESDRCTVLDVAVKKNDMSLVSTVMGLFDSGGKIRWGDCYFPTELSWDTLIEGETGSTMELAKELGRQGILDVLSQPKFANVAGGVSDGSRPDGYLDIAKLKLDIIAAIDECWKGERNEEYVADLDYNIEEDEERLSLLRYHFLCKSIYKMYKFTSTSGERSFTELHYEFLSKVHDARGRTANHTALEYWRSNPELFPFCYSGRGFFSTSDVILNFFEISRDSRGRTSLMRAIIIHYLKEDLDLFDLLFNTLCDLICDAKLSNQELELLALLADRGVLELVVKKKNILMEFDKIDRPLLSIVAASNNQTLLRILLKANMDPMVVDEGGHTALHFAVNPNTLPFYLSPSYFNSKEEYLKVKDKWVKRIKENGSNGSQRACILMLLQFGVDLSQEDKHGDIPDPGTTIDADFQKWWHETLFKDTTEKKNNFNAAGNALSVVGTLVAATSYVGPLQPPLGLNEGYIATNILLIRMFVVTNTLAFYLAIASVMFAVVPSLPMPQEGMIEELRRARHTIGFSLCLLLSSIVCIIISFASATTVVMNNDDHLEFYSLLLSPSIIGWCFCLIAIFSFFIRLMRLIFYKNSTVRRIYKFSLSKYCKDRWKVMKRMCELEEAITWFTTKLCNN